MVACHGVDDLRRLPVPAQQIDADFHVGAFGFVVDGFADVVQQAGTAGHFHVAAQLRGHHRGDVGHFDGMLQHVLTVAVAVLQPTQQLHQLRMKAVHVGAQARLLAFFADALLHFLAGFGHHLLDPGRMNAPVGDELFQGDAGDFPPHRIEAGQDHRFGRVVDDQVDAGLRLQRADVAAFPSDDAPLHVVAGQADHGNGRFGHVVRGTALNGQADDVAGPLVRFFFGLLLQLADHDRHVVANFVLDGLEQVVLGLFRR